MFLPWIFDERACSDSLVPWQSGQVVNVTALSTNRRTCGCIDSTSLESIDFWTFTRTPSKVRLTPSILIFSGSPYSSFLRSLAKYFPIGLSMSKPAPLKIRPYQPSML
jgi:hypothetical protein